jgi:glc operon protein GlcG
MDCLTMELCQAMTGKILGIVSQDGGKPIAICVCDHGGTVAGSVRMDGVPARSVHLAQHKAYTAMRMQTTTASFMARLEREKADIAFFCDPNLTPFPGGAPILSAGGEVIGAVGISGRSSEEDQHLADIAAAMASARG